MQRLWGTIKKNFLGKNDSVKSLQAVSKEPHENLEQKREMTNKDALSKNDNSVKNLPAVSKEPHANLEQKSDMTDGQALYLFLQELIRLNPNSFPDGKLNLGVGFVDNKCESPRREQIVTTIDGVTVNMDASIAKNSEDLNRFMPSRDTERSQRHPSLESKSHPYPSFLKSLKVKRTDLTPETVANALWLKDKSEEKTRQAKSNFDMWAKTKALSFGMKEVETVLEKRYQMTK